MIRTRILAAGALLTTVAFVAALVASPVNAQSTSSPSGSSSDGEPHTNVSGPHTQAAMFTQCPAIGADTGCAILLVINANGTVSVQQDVAQGPYDGSEDSLIGVQNNTSISVSHLDLTSTIGAFGFENDGICSATFLPWTGSAGCPFGTTGYEGPNTSFSNISADLNNGTVNFTGGLAPGGHVFFSLEEQITASGLVVLPVTVPPTPPPPATVVVVSPKFTG
jgi:hypothetical protein